MDEAVLNGMVDPQVVLIDARCRGAALECPSDGVVAMGALARYDRPAPTLDGYDALLTGSEG